MTDKSNSIDSLIDIFKNILIIKFMKKISTASLLIMAIICLNACYKVVGHGPLVSENRSISNFTSIDFEVPGDLYYTQDSIYKIEIEAQQNIVKEIETYINGNELTIRVRDHVHLRSHEDIRIYVTAPSVTALSLNSSGSLKVIQPYKPSDMKLAVKGSGTMTINQLETNHIDASVSGSGELLVFTGKANHEKTDISGSGRIDLMGITTNTANTHINGSGSIRLNVIQELNNKISGSGTVYYRGTPVVNTTISGSGKVVRL